MKMSARLLLLVMAAVAAQAQTRQLKFEVASVKVSGASDSRGGDAEFLPGGKLLIRNVSLRWIIAAAYNLPFQSGRLTWEPQFKQVLETRYDISAAAPIDIAHPGRVEMRQMMQALLAERFGLKLRREIRDQPLYALTLARGGPKLEAAGLTEKDCESRSGVQACHEIGGGQGRGLHAVAADLDDVVVFVQNWTDKPMVDKTGLTGLYRLNTEGWVPMQQMVPTADGTLTPEQMTMTSSDRPTIFQMFEKLGLRMEQQRGAVEMFRVVGVERPSEN
jgi:uncharacterized protein (TIGR03435 family)